jgi:hypothetical protein
MIDNFEKRSILLKFTKSEDLHLGTVLSMLNPALRDESDAGTSAD